MDIIREHLMYKNSPLQICMANIPSQEQYEVIRILLESNRDNVTICTHDATNKHIIFLMEKLKVKFVQCWATEAPVATFLPSVV
jgi:hypothetical protein